MDLKKINFQRIKKERVENAHLRKNVVVSFIIIFGLTASLLYLVLNVNPDKFWAKPIFFLLFFANWFYIFSVLFSKKRRGVIAAGVITLCLFMRYLDVDNIYYFLAVVAAGGIFELVFYLKNR